MHGNCKHAATCKRIEIVNADYWRFSHIQLCFGKLRSGRFCCKNNLKTEINSTWRNAESLKAKNGGILVILEKIENSAVLFVRRDLELNKRKCHVMNLI